MRRLTILLAAVGALLLLPAAQAFGAGELHVEIVGTGQGEINSEEGIEGGFYKGSPPIKCSYNGKKQSGTCDTMMVEEPEFEPGLEAVGLHAIPAETSIFPVSNWGVKSEPEGIIVFAPGCKGTSECTPFIESGTGNVFVKAEFKCKTEGGCLPPPEGPLLTIKIEEGSGTVVSNPAGLECSGSAPKECSAEFEKEKSVTLTASPAAGYLFKGWKKCDTGGVNGRQCTVKMSEAKTVGANFVKAWNLEGSKSNGQGIFTTSPGGVNCGFGCLSSSALYKEGSLTLKEKPAKHFHFVEFKGGTGSAATCNGVKTETCTISSLSSDSAIEEVYAEDAKHTLSLAKEGGGQGSVKTKPTSINCGYTCGSAEGEYFFNEEAAVTVVLNKGTSSVTWVKGAGSCTGNALTCSVPMSTNHELVAKFE